jgi:hypothetical protein
MRALLVGSLVLGLIVALVFAYAYQSFIDTNNEYLHERVIKELELRRMCAEKWPLRGQYFEECIDDKGSTGRD